MTLLYLDVITLLNYLCWRYEEVYNRVFIV